TWALDGAIRFFYYEEQQTYAAQLRLYSGEQKFFVTERSEWPEQERFFLLKHYLEALKHLPREEIERLAPGADRYQVDMIDVPGGPEDFDRVVPYRADGAGPIDGWFIHLAVQPLFGEPDGPLHGLGTDRIHLFYGTAADTPPLTETELIRRFTADAASPDVAVTGCVLAPDGADGLEGVVQYEEPGGGPWQLAFSRGGVFFPVGLDFGPGHTVQGDLTYLGGGTVRARIENTADGSLQECDMTFTYDPDLPGAHFEAASREVLLPIEYSVAPIGRGTLKLATVMTEEDAGQILALLDATPWAAGRPDCEFDCALNLGGRLFYYHSQCGSFVQYDLGEMPAYSRLEPPEARVAQLSGEEMVYVNSLIARYIDLPDAVTDIAPPRLTLETLLDLHEREGAALDWEDFSSYEWEDIGSGLIILRYPIDERLCLLVGGGSLSTPPMYLRLVSEADTDRSLTLAEPLAGNAASREEIDAFLAALPSRR
ncbi:MAG: hypothetical protein IJF59_00885, partial [Clostridia bacterium]|nr:hypothetical protein [Clostridia bacterium]